MAARKTRTTKPGAAASNTIAARLARAGIKSDWDFVLHLPLRYEDETRVTPIAQLVAGNEAQVEAEVIAADVVYRGRRQLRVTVRDDTGQLVLRFLNFYSSQAKQMSVGRRLRIFGMVRGGLAGDEMIHPRVRACDFANPLPQSLTPIYPSPEGVPQSWLRKRIGRALRDVDIEEVLPAPMLARDQLAGLKDSIERLHRPPPDADALALEQRTDSAWRRLMFDELLAQQLALRAAREARADRRACPFAPGGSISTELQARLPFTLTGAQQRVWGEIERDLAGHQPMHRLLQGDVGSGKTVIAALAAARAIENGFQAALMAPTEILAEQHFRRVAEWLSPLGVRIEWLAGRQSGAVKRAAHDAVGRGDAQMIVGTHALIQEAVVFTRLGLAIVDEQHRFGVAQRLALRSGPGTSDVPHLLMLSATPIPRTLAMSYLADLDVSVLDELPPGRRPVITKLVSTRRRDEVMQRIRADVAAGRQSYWVCPLIESSETIAAAAAIETFERIEAMLPDLRIGLLHGQLPTIEKAKVMQRFTRCDIDVLVATTVIEVGVDVPNATLMVIEHAERFGLAQLHQLRGRVGRGADQSFCVLLYDEPLSEPAVERLKVIYETNDGFEVAQRDLMMRGPGELLGARQSGTPLLRFADLQRDAPLVERARLAATELLHAHPAIAQQHVRRWFAGTDEFLIA
ncbi:MAG: ATP-dependent DNA helicase RecG [Burkholderiaceae bacterium]|nr:ATP-dependent DNA helicase RecG [Burkholderiaceae bacterium]